MATDRRVKYTKMVLRDSLIELLREKPISRLTITKLCAKADINRATFYSHYTDQFDLLKQIETAFITDINSHLDHFVIEAGEASFAQILTQMLTYIQANSSLCQALLSNNSDLDFQTNVMKVVGERVLFQWRKGKPINETAAEYMYTYVAVGGIGVIRKWLQDDDPMPAQELAEFLTRIVYKGIELFIG